MLRWISVFITILFYQESLYILKVHLVVFNKNSWYNFDAISFIKRVNF